MCKGDQDKQGHFRNVPVLFASYPPPQEQWADQVLVRGAELWQQPVSYQFAHGYTQVRKNIFLPKKRFFQNELAILPGFKR